MKEIIFSPLGLIIFPLVYIAIGLAVRFIALFIDWITNNKFELGYWMDTEGYMDKNEYYDNK